MQRCCLLYYLNNTSKGRSYWVYVIIHVALKQGSTCKYPCFSGRHTRIPFFSSCKNTLWSEFQVKWEFYSSSLWTLLGSADWDEYTLQTTPLFLMKVNRYDLFLLKLNNWLTGATEDDICFFVKPAEWSPLLTRICLSGSFGLLRLHSLSCQPQTSMEKA